MGAGAALGPLLPGFKIVELRLWRGSGFQKRTDALARKELPAREDHVGPVAGISAAPVLAGAEPPQIGSIEHQTNVFGRRTRSQGVLPAVLGDGRERSGVPQGP